MMALQPILGSVTGPDACAGLYTFVYPWNRLVWLVYVWVELNPLERARFIGFRVLFAHRSAQADWLHALGFWGTWAFTFATFSPALLQLQLTRSVCPTERFAFGQGPADTAKGFAC